MTNEVIEYKYFRLMRLSRFGMVPLNEFEYNSLQNEKDCVKEFGSGKMAKYIDNENEQYYRVCKCVRFPRVGIVPTSEFVSKSLQKKKKMK